MTPRTQEARIIGYTTTYKTYQVITTTGKWKIVKEPKPIDQTKEDSDEENPEWPANNPVDKAIEDLQDMAENRWGA